jgi:hypothetical protein
MRKEVKAGVEIVTGLALAFFGARGEKKDYDQAARQGFQNPGAYADKGAVQGLMTGGGIVLTVVGVIEAQEQFGQKKREKGIEKPNPTPNSSKTLGQG